MQSDAAMASVQPVPRILSQMFIALGPSFKHCVYIGPNGGSPYGRDGFVYETCKSTPDRASQNQLERSPVETTT